MLNSAAIARHFEFQRCITTRAASTAFTCRTRRSPKALGPIVDHEWEHLAPSDQMIMRTRRRLLMAARALRDQGIMPPGSDDASVYRGGVASRRSKTGVIELSPAVGDRELYMSES